LKPKQGLQLLNPLFSSAFAHKFT